MSEATKFAVEFTIEQFDKIRVAYNAYLCSRMKETADWLDAAGLKDVEKCMDLWRHIDEQYGDMQEKHWAREESRNV
jgi:hypothetical protein